MARGTHGHRAPPCRTLSYRYTLCVVSARVGMCGFARGSQIKRFKVGTASSMGDIICRAWVLAAWGCLEAVLAVFRASLGPLWLWSVELSVARAMMAGEGRKQVLTDTSWTQMDDTDALRMWQGARLERRLHTGGNVVIWTKCAQKTILSRRSSFTRTNTHFWPRLQRVSILGRLSLKGSAPRRQTRHACGQSIEVRGSSVLKGRPVLGLNRPTGLT